MYEQFDIPAVGLEQDSCQPELRKQKRRERERCVD